MTEAEWFAVREPEQLLLWLGAGRSRSWSKRKSGLFAVACANRTKSFMRGAITIRGLDLAERLAEDVAGEAEYDTYITECRAATPPNTLGPENWAWTFLPT
jgi:hypothetical protein